MDELRPETWDDYQGQRSLKAKLSVHVQAAANEGRMPEHILLGAPAGYGKTTLASIIANELSEPLEVLTMPVTTNALMRVVRSFEGVLLLDEIHRASKAQQEDLLPLLEFGYVQTAGNRRVDVGSLLIIGATTEPWALEEPLLDRFAITPQFEDYTDEDMESILRGMCERAGVEADDALVSELAPAAAGTPRRCRRFALAIRDLSAIGEDISAERIFDLCDVASDGLSVQHIKYMETLEALGGSKGIKVIASLLRVSEKQVQKLERDLIKRGYLEIHNARELTRAGYNRLKE